jgi:hypothetical protein
MKRRTMFGALWSGLVSLALPIRGANIESNILQSSSGQLTPYDAIKKVFDEFVSPDPKSEFSFEDPIEILSGADDRNTVYCKVVRFADKGSIHHDIWLLFNDYQHKVMNMVIKGGK